MTTPRAARCRRRSSWRTANRTWRWAHPAARPFITTVLQILVGRLDLGLALPEAIAAPRASQRNTASVQAEPAFLASPEAEALGRLGHTFTITPQIGPTTGIELQGDDRMLAAVEPNRRGGGAAAVVSPCELK